MRPIDADALKDNFPNARADVFENCRNCTCLDNEQINQIIDSAPTIGGWNSVKDNPPDGECIAYSEKWDEMIFGYIYKTEASDTGYEAENEQDFLRDVSHWMSKPERPTGDKS